MNQQRRQAEPFGEGAQPTLGQFAADEHAVQPDPGVAEQQSDGRQQEPHLGPARGGARFPFVHLAVAGFDAEPAAKLFAEPPETFRLKAPKGKHQDVAAPARPVWREAALQGRALIDDDPDLDAGRAALVSHLVGVEATAASAQKPLGAFGRGRVFRAAAAMHHGHQEGLAVRLQELHYVDAVRLAIQQQIPRQNAFPRIRPISRFSTATSGSSLHT